MWEVCMKCAVKSSRQEEDLSLAIAPSVPPLPRERLEQEREEVESDTDEEEDEREITDFDDSLGSQGDIQTPAASNSQAHSPNEQRTPITASTRHGRRNNEGPHMIAPLREAMGPQGGRVLIKVPFSPVRKPNGKYRLVQDLRAINEIVKDIHPVVANPYTLLTSVSEQFEWFTVIDLKDAFFCIPLAIESIKYFAFEWEDPATGRKKQLTWTRLPQGFKNSPTIFGNQLARELEEWKTTQVKEPPTSYTILQYVDDILLATQDRGTCVNLTIALLNMLGQVGYRVSKEKAQLDTMEFRPSTHPFRAPCQLNLQDSLASSIFNVNKHTPRSSINCSRSCRAHALPLLDQQEQRQEESPPEAGVQLSRHSRIEVVVKAEGEEHGKDLE
ncbi:hypothetical protein DV515_00012870 [Chloebia gouldiae]|uniref:ribonuclease H n=1 Tax=Chloebia gouldiae TaxID=44316 RepID=A0A3L8S2K7_CHLGU|nr:hypothetical protein DV515_00012870 [Chloebia gouldiae]